MPFEKGNKYRFTEGNPHRIKDGQTLAAKPEGQTAERYTFRLYPWNIADIDYLIENGYATDRTDAIRKASAEARQRLEGEKQ